MIDLLNEIEGKPIVRINVTDSNGVLLGVIGLDADTLRHPVGLARYIGEQVLSTLPAGVTKP